MDFATQEKRNVSFIVSNYWKFLKVKSRFLKLSFTTWAYSKTNFACIVCILSTKIKKQDKSGGLEVFVESTSKHTQSINV